MCPASNDAADSRGPNPAADNAAEAVRVVLEIPTDARFVSLARTAAIGMVADEDPDLETVENLRLAVNELVSAVLENSTGATVSIQFELGAGGDTELFVRAIPSDAAGEVSVDPLTRRILESVTSEHRFLPDGSAELRIHQTRG
ncbi:MAG: hypothetical protein R2714_13830 [Microthrixaceae bacterium]